LFVSHFDECSRMFVQNVIQRLNKRNFLWRCSRVCERDENFRKQILWSVKNEILNMQSSQNMQLIFEFARRSFCLIKINRCRSFSKTSSSSKSQSHIVSQKMCLLWSQEIDFYWYSAAINTINDVQKDVSNQNIDAMHKLICKIMKTLTFLLFTNTRKIDRRSSSFVRDVDYEFSVLL
jgi:hypothetical protein